MASPNDLQRVAEKVRAYKEGASRDMPTSDELTFLARRGNYQNQQGDRAGDNVGMNDVDKYIDDLLGPTTARSPVNSGSAVPIPADRPANGSAVDGTQGLPITGDIPIPEANPRTASGEGGSSLLTILASVLGGGAGVLAGKKVYDTFLKGKNDVEDGINDSLGEKNNAVTQEGGKNVIKQDAAAPISNIDDGINQQLETAKGAENADAGTSSQVPVSRDQSLEEIVNDLRGATPEQAIDKIKGMGYNITVEDVHRMARENMVPPEVAARLIRKLAL